jgi:hypothetical protein
MDLSVIKQLSDAKTQSDLILLLCKNFDRSDFCNVFEWKDAINEYLVLCGAFSFGHQLKNIILFFLIYSQGYLFILFIHSTQ